MRGPYHSHGTRLNSRNVVDAPRFPSGGPRDATPLRAPLSPITNLINPEFNNAPVIGGTPVRGPYHSHGTRLNSRNVVDAPRFPSGGPRDATPLRAPLSPITNLINPEFNNAPVIGGTPVRGPYHMRTRLNSRNVVDAPTPLEGQGSENGINLPSVFPSSNKMIQGDS